MESSWLNQLKSEILQTERDFALMAIEQGMKDAFIYFADKAAVISRDNHLYRGKEAIASYFDQLNYRNTQISWDAEFVDVTASGDLAYTYGRYFCSFNDVSGKVHESAGIFHTVWKRQADGTWRYVWD